MDEQNNAHEGNVEMVTGAECSGTLDLRALTARSEEPRVSRPTLDLVLSIGSPRAPDGVAISGATPALRRVRQIAAGVFGGAALFALGAVAGHGARGELRPTIVSVSPEGHGATIAGAPVASAGEKPLRSAVAQEVAAAASVEPAEVTPAVVADARDVPAPARRTRTDAVAAGTPSSPRAPASNESPARPGAGAPTLDELLHRATATTTSSPPIVPAVLSSAPTSSATPSLPETPTRAQVREAMDAIAPAIRACAEGAHGQALVTVVFSGETGRVRSATVSGEYAGTPAGSCIARAARGAELAPFARATFTIAYPFAL